MTLNNKNTIGEKQGTGGYQRRDLPAVFRYRHGVTARRDRRERSEISIFGTFGEMKRKGVPSVALDNPANKMCM